MDTKPNTSSTKKARTGAITVCVSDGGGNGGAVTNAELSLYEANYIHDCNRFDCNGWKANEEERIGTRRTDSKGCVTYSDLTPGIYVVSYGHYPKTDPECVSVQSGCVTDVCFKPGIDMSVQQKYLTKDCKTLECHRAQTGDIIQFTLYIKNSLQDIVAIKVPQGFKQDPSDKFTFIKKIMQPGQQEFKVSVGFPLLKLTPVNSAPGLAEMFEQVVVDADENTPLPISGNINVSLTRTETAFTEDKAFWTAIRNSTEALSFNNYLRFMDWIFCGKTPTDLSAFESSRFDTKKATWQDPLLKTRFLPFTDTDAYRVVKAATEAFVMVNCGILKTPQPFTQTGDRDLDEAYLDRRDLPLPTNKGLLSDAFNSDYLVTADGNGKTLPYLAVIRRKLPDIPIKIKPFEDAAGGISADECFGILQDKLDNPCLLELIWSYWHEEGMLVQTMNSISRRFQNVRSPNRQDPLANMEIDPLRPLNNIFWGYIQDEQHRLTVGRRHYEYDHHYGLRLEGKAVQNSRPVDTRSKFLEAFHHLLRLCTVFYKQDDDTTVKADAFPVLNALKEVHLILSQGAHNQFGDLPSMSGVNYLVRFDDNYPGRF
ncbi:MAG: hypothetical protein PHD43_04860 [Methylococcales bacterium]|nr:hypothetical protein [Methylococcales bacterium]